MRILHPITWQQSETVAAGRWTAAEGDILAAAHHAHDLYCNRPSIKAESLTNTWTVAASFSFQPELQSVEQGETALAYMTTSWGSLGHSHWPLALGSWLLITIVLYPFMSHLKIASSMQHHAAFMFGIHTANADAVALHYIVVCNLLSCIDDVLWRKSHLWNDIDHYNITLYTLQPVSCGASFIPMQEQCEVPTQLVYAA